MNVGMDSEVPLKETTRSFPHLMSTSKMGMCQRDLIAPHNGRIGALFGCLVPLATKITVCQSLGGYVDVAVEMQVNHSADGRKPDPLKASLNPRKKHKTNPIRFYKPPTNRHQPVPALPVHRLESRLLGFAEALDVLLLGRHALGGRLAASLARIRIRLIGLAVGVAIGGAWAMGQTARAARHSGAPFFRRSEVLMT